MNIYALMTMQEFFEDVDILPLILIVVGFIFLARPLASYLKKREVERERREIYGLDDQGPLITETQVKVVEKSVVSHRVGRRSNETITDQYSGSAVAEIPVNWCVFELQNGSRIRLAIENNECFDLLVVGDIGVLDYLGRRFIRFKK